jgi:hypothetical protein
VLPGLETSGGHTLRLIIGAAHWSSLVSSCLIAQAIAIGAVGVCEPRKVALGVLVSHVWKKVLLRWIDDSRRIYTATEKLRYWEWLPAVQICGHRHKGWLHCI